MSISQSAKSVFMVSPASFAYDVETESSNSFQTEISMSPAEVINIAMAEFEAAVTKLRQAGIDVIAHYGDPSDNRPSATFPNNWISTWPDGTVYTYPMATDSRRVERDSRVTDQLAERFFIKQIIDISDSEKSGRYLESTGAIVYDHLNKLAYGCISERCDEEVFTSHVESLGYQPVAFHGYDQIGVPIYHTNVMMGVQSTTAVVCSDSITDPEERTQVLGLLNRDRTVIDISFEQMGAFCGNVLEVENRYGNEVLVMSQSAYDAFSDEQRQQLATDKELLPINIPTLETGGGGSARCMLAEIFLPTL